MPKTSRALARRTVGCYDAVKLNISIESVGKSNDFDALLRQCYPATAPFRESNDKKLFGAVKKDLKGTPKGAKKIDDLSKKIQRSNQDILAAFKSVGIGNVNSRKIQTPTGARQMMPSGLLAGLKKPQTTASEAVARNKSFRTDKMNDFMKNNFFVMNKYFGNQPSSYASAKAGLKNKTSDEVIKHLQRTNANASEAGPTLMISEDDAGKLNLEDLTFIEKRLNGIVHIMESDFEIYDLIKEYVDIVQEENFSDFFTIIRNPKVRLVIKNSMIVERWAVFFVFYFYFNQNLADQIMIFLKELMLLVHRNILIYLKLFAHWISPFESLEVGSADCSPPTRVLTTSSLSAMWTTITQSRRTARTCAA